MIAVVPGYISRSVAGSYDNEGKRNVRSKILTFQRLSICALMGLCFFTMLRYSHLLHASDILHVDQGCKNWIHLLGRHVRSRLFLHGKLGIHKFLICQECMWVNVWRWTFILNSQVSSWGGYVFLINLIPLHVLVLMLTGRFSHRIYVAYCTVYCLGTILSMQISFVGFQVSFMCTYLDVLMDLQ